MIIIIITAISIPYIKSTLREAHNRQAYEQVLTSMRRAHAIAVQPRGVVGGAGLNTMYFQVDGTVLRDSQTGAVASGVIYVGRTGDPTSNRAASILGTTGRIKGWRLNQKTNTWVIY